MEVKPIAHIKRDVVREFMIETVLLAIHKPIYIVQDNSSSRLQLLSREDLISDLFVNLQVHRILIYYIWVSFVQSKPSNI
jgi:hypothetical protein